MGECVPKKLIIDTDPGVDDAMAILAAVNSPEVDIIGITTIFGNVTTSQATKNAFILLNLAGRPDDGSQIPVAEGSATSLSGLEKVPAAFVHGEDGFGNTNQAAVEGVPVKMSAAEFLVDAVKRWPGEVTVLALGPLTNIALAAQLDPSFVDNLGELVILGGAFHTSGNVTPAAEANIFGDPEAADQVLGMTSKIRIVGLDVTHQTFFTRSQLKGLEGTGRGGSFLNDISQFYLEYYRTSYGLDACHVHDPATLVGVIRPDLFTWAPSEVRVATEGIFRGCTIRDTGVKDWGERTHPWSGRPKVLVAVGVDSNKVVDLLMERMARPLASGRPLEC